MSAPAFKKDGMGSLLSADGSCRFRVWAPFAKRVRVMGTFTDWQRQPVDLACEGNGIWSTDVPNVRALHLYKYLIENVGGPGNDDSQTWQRADARALQVESSNEEAASYVVPPFDQNNRPVYTTPKYENFILYQLHVGSFAGLNDLRAVPVRNRTATFLDVIAKLEYIRDLGFTGIALLPIGSVFADLQGCGGTGEGYQGNSDMFAPKDAYGSSQEKTVLELLRLVDAAHATGLAVIFDVVYAHAAYRDNRYWRYDGNCFGADGGGEYFENGHDTRFGAGFAMWRREVKDFFLDNARLLLRDYRGDGLRFDAIQFVRTDAITYITSALRSEMPEKYLIAEYNIFDPESAAQPVDPFGVLGFSATWDMASPDHAYNALSGMDSVNNLLSLIGNFKNPDSWNSVRYLTGAHDQIYDSDGSHLGARYLVDRFGGRRNDWARAKVRLAWALNVALPGAPMLFMGTEGHLDGWWDPDHVHGEHRVDWEKMGDPLGMGMQRLVRDANNLRWHHPALRSPLGKMSHTDYEGQVVAFIRWTPNGDVLLVVVNVSDNQWAFHDYGVEMGGQSGSWMEIFSSQAEVYGGSAGTGNYRESLAVLNSRLAINLPSWCVLIFRKL
jgi:1,4-alpha-glucan branching enzyme